MATSKRRLAHNVPGDFFVDASCIDCDTCRWMAPDTFTAREGQASVHRQPETELERRRALMALVSCPSGSIGTVEKQDPSAALASLPDPIAPDVYHCGYHSRATFGAASYLVVREEGNILIDSPRFTRPLVRKLESLGGVRWMFLTHRDDVVDHEKFRAHFGCERVLHADDVTGATRGVERIFSGRDPFTLEPGGNVVVIPTPGHTKGSSCLLYRNTFLFTGDHLAWSAERGHIYGFRSVTWYDWGELVRSAEKLTAYDFEWILPGHGRRCHFPLERMRAEMRKALAWMDGVTA